MKIFGFDHSKEGYYNYIMEHLYGKKQVITGNNGIFKSQTPEAYGANAFYNSINSTNEGANVQFMSKNCAGSYNMKSSLGFAGTKLSYIDNLGNSDGKVSLSEYSDTMKNVIDKEAMLEALDVNSDGFISAGEEAAFTLLTDYLDGKSDGMLTEKGKANTFYIIDNCPDYFSRCINHIYENYTEQYEDDFQMPWNEIDGSSGPYDNDTAVGRGANAGAEILELYINDKKDQLAFSNYQYMFENDEGELDIDSGLASHSYIVQIYDKDKDGKVVEWEVPDELFRVADINGDGELSEGELLAKTMASDVNNDGIVTYEEKRDFDVRIENSETDIEEREALSQEIESVYNENSIAEKEENFEMPDKSNPLYPPNYGNPSKNQDYGAIYQAILDFLANFSSFFRI